jgi:hypothetical protein
MQGCMMSLVIISAVALDHFFQAWVEISPANRYLTEDNLHRQAKQTKVARERAFLKGSGRDVGAEIKQEESFDAQKKLYKGSYFDLSRASNNLMEPPDLRRFDSEERVSRMKSWRSFIRNALSVIVMGRLDAPHLAQRVDAILLRSLDIFLSDPDIIERYNLAFSKGWKSSEWKDIPTLKDFVRFCSIARLNIQKTEAIDHQAINQITSQIAALLVSPLG